MQPIVNIFKLEVAEAELEEFFRIGKTNFTQSIVQEEGTLAMYLAEDAREQDFYVIEVYRDRMAYQEHIESAHFADFVAFSQEFIPKKERIALIPQVLLEKERLIEEDLSKLSMRLTVVHIKESMERLFKNELFEAMQARESGVLYAGHVADSPNTWYIMHIFRIGYSLIAPFLENKAYLEEIGRRELSPIAFVNKGNVVYSVIEKEL
ncbi:putative quinol monooxygenase [Streptococcus cuniculi]|uniref:ABM domain-containing protein n=1 Tax=Streptococcus cuniculi TaxID=1432788 RepID=A0A4Y9JF77_9STRE|nr:antibiotic biosynthesis monooxygenase [Streptococcus cuniculi]MBF0777576.1 antibiotic biosynthesis monooxygenase [Streptococcus cuniculi]TFU98619.1 hypothetical protein E4T82_02320 [Streptococcus cuniculi]